MLTHAGNLPQRLPTSFIAQSLFVVHESSISRYFFDTVNDISYPLLSFLASVILIIRIPPISVTVSLLFGLYVASYSEELAVIRALINPVSSAMLSNFTSSFIGFIVAVSFILSLNSSPRSASFFSGFLHSPLKYSHSSHRVPSGKTHILLTPSMSEINSIVPLFSLQYIDAGLLVSAGFMSSSFSCFMLLKYPR